MVAQQAIYRERAHGKMVGRGRIARLLSANQWRVISETASRQKIKRPVLSNRARLAKSAPSS
jgi:hypothetical protein